MQFLHPKRRPSASETIIRDITRAISHAERTVSSQGEWPDTLCSRIQPAESEQSSDQRPYAPRIAYSELLLRQVNRGLLTCVWTYEPGLVTQHD
jgi:hypothetical protein